MDESFTKGSHLFEPWFETNFKDLACDDITLLSSFSNSSSRNFFVARVIFFFTYRLVLALKTTIGSRKFLLSGQPIKIEKKRKDNRGKKRLIRGVLRRWFSTQ